MEAVIAITLAAELPGNLFDGHAVLGELQDRGLGLFTPQIAFILHMADIVICHGGQGTLQTAIYCGTRVVDVAAQTEQFLNPYNIEPQGAGIRIPMRKWNARNIQKAVCRILEHPEFIRAARPLKQRMDSMDGASNSVRRIWEKIIEVRPSV